MVGFEIPGDFVLGPNDVALLRFRLDPKTSLGQFGAWVVANSIACDGQEWTEGAWRRDQVWCVLRCRDKGERGVQGKGCPAAPDLGVTWRCPTDPHVQDTKKNCPNPSPWTDR